MSAIPEEFAESIRERYVLERPLGQGGMATVYLARDLKHDRGRVDARREIARPSWAGEAGRRESGNVQGCRTGDVECRE